MAQQLEDVLEDLGISQYLEAFIDQGFDTWETILDITESDLDVLNVKLGHRRKLQRKIANYRGIAPETALVSPTRPATDEAVRPDGTPKNAVDTASYPVDGRSDPSGVSTKRKYRRHPKPDESAPERPPSAYVLFSNKMREKLKGQNLSFTEIAKLVGENWQTLTPLERKPYETEAQTAKDKYNHAMVLYKKTPEYQRYILYLQEFKARHSNQSQDKDAFKRIKLSEGSASLHSPSQPPSSVRSTPPPPSSQQSRHRQRSFTASGSISSIEGHHERGETPSSFSHRENGVGSAVSASDSHYSSASPTPGPHDGLADESAVHSPHSNGHLDWSPRATSMSPREMARGSHEAQHQHQHQHHPQSHPHSHPHSHHHHHHPPPPPPPTHQGHLSHSRSQSHSQGHASYNSGLGTTTTTSSSAWTPAESTQQPPQQPHQQPRAKSLSGPMSLPSLSDMFDSRQLPMSAATVPASPSTGSASPVPPPATGFVASVSVSSSMANPSVESGPRMGSGGDRDRGDRGDRRPSMLRHDQSCSTVSSMSIATSASSASTASTSTTSTSNNPRTPLDGSLPIHALLSGKPPSPSSPSARPPSASLPPPYHAATQHPVHVTSASSPLLPGTTPGPMSPKHAFSPVPRPFTSTVDGTQPKVLPY